MMAVISNLNNVDLCDLQGATNMESIINEKPISYKQYIYVCNKMSDGVYSHEAHKDGICIFFDLGTSAPFNENGFINFVNYSIQMSRSGL